MKAQKDKLAAYRAQLGDPSPAVADHGRCCEPGIHQVQGPAMVRLAVV